MSVGKFREIHRKLRPSLDDNQVEENVAEINSDRYEGIAINKLSLMDSSLGV